MKIFRIFLWTLLVLVGVGIAAQLIWTYTGSGQWEALPEKNGVRVFSFKAPGTAVEKFKGIFKAKATVGAFVKFIQDPGVCEDVGCHDARIIEQVGSKLQYQTFQYDYPSPFKTREFVVRQAFSRNPDTRAVLVDLSAEPGKIAPNDCCTRVTEMHNTWLLTPAAEWRARGGICHRHVGRRVLPGFPHEPGSQGNRVRAARSAGHPG